MFVQPRPRKTFSSAPPPSKKRKTKSSAPAEITFDFAAREEYLTGFHKRKEARKKAAQEENAKKEKEEKLKFRRELRSQRKVDLENHVAEVNKLLRIAAGDMDETTAAMSAKPTSRSKSEASDSEEEWTGFEEPPPLDQEQEYIDEDKYTTVTIESVGISRDGFQKSDPDALTEEEAKELEEKKKKWAKEKEDEDKAKAAKLEKLRLKKAAGRKKKFRYEAPAERKAERMKQRAKKSAKASKRKGE